MSYILPSTLTQQNAVAVELDGLRDLAHGKKNYGRVSAS
jgi:hypothetical protein